MRCILSNFVAFCKVKLGFALSCFSFDAQWYFSYNDQYDNHDPSLLDDFHGDPPVVYIAMEAMAHRKSHEA